MRSYLRPLGEVLVTCGVVVVFFLAYMVWGTAVREGSAQHRFAGELSRQWASPGTSEALLGRPGHVALGQPFAFIRIPAFGAHWQFVIVQGTGLAQLALGPGHVVGTQWPGQVGNFAVAGHRVTAGNPFWSEPSLVGGDQVYVETYQATYDYQIVAPPVWVAPDDTAMLAAVPGHPDVAPHQALITLITCDPAWTGTSRVVATGALIKVTPRRAAVRS